MKVHETSAGRVRQYRQRQREACRKLVRLYLDAEASARLAQLAGGQPHAAFAAALLTTAIAQAWTAGEARQQREREEREGCSQARPNSAATGASAGAAHFRGCRRRSLAALDDATGKPGL